MRHLSGTIDSLFERGLYTKSLNWLESHIERDTKISQGYGNKLTTMFFVFVTPITAVLFSVTHFRCFYTFSVVGTFRLIRGAENSPIT